MVIPTTPCAGTEGALFGDLLCQPPYSDLLRTPSTPRVLNTGAFAHLIRILPAQHHKTNFRGPRRKHFRWGILRGPRNNFRRKFCGVNFRGPHHKIFDFVMGQIGDLLCQPPYSDLLRTRSTLPRCNTRLTSQTPPENGGVAFACARLRLCARGG